MELSKLSVHLSIVRGCVARMSMRAFWARVETTWMFSGYIVMATAKRASATFSRPRHAQIWWIPCRRKSKQGSKIIEAKVDDSHLWARIVSYLTFSYLEYAVHESALVMQHPGGITCRGNASTAVPAKRLFFPKPTQCTKFFSSSICIVHLIIVTWVMAPRCLRRWAVEA
jgi:hypothetical protein